MAGKRKRGSEEAPSSPVAPTRARKVAVKKGGKTAPREGEMFYLFKSEPESRYEKGMEMKFSIDDLIASENGTAEWDGVRNYQARNLMREMKMGDRGFFYHSNCKPPGIVGIVEVVREAYPDDTQFDPKNPHFDPRSSKENPKWDMVDVKFIRKLGRKISLDELKEYREKEVGFFCHTDPQGKHVKIQDADGSCHFEYRHDGGFMSLFFFLRDGVLVTNAQDDLSQVSVTTRTYLAEDKEFFVYSLNEVNSAEGDISEIRTKFATFDPLAKSRESIASYLMEPPGRCKDLLKEILSNPPTGFGSGVEAFKNFMANTSESAIREIKEWNRRRPQI